MAWFTFNFLVFHFLSVCVFWFYFIFGGVWGGQHSLPHLLSISFPKTFVHTTPIPRVPSFSQWLTHSGSALITLTYFFPLLWDPDSFSAWELHSVFLKWPIWSLFQGLLFWSLLQETVLSVCIRGRCVQLDGACLGDRAHRLGHGPSTPSTNINTTIHTGSTNCFINDVLSQNCVATIGSTLTNGETQSEDMVNVLG